MRERISRADMLECARRTGVLTGKSLRKGPDTHHSAWLWHCKRMEIAFISLSLGRHHAKVEFVINTVHPDMELITHAPDLYLELQAAIGIMWKQMPYHNSFRRYEGRSWMEVEGMSNLEGEWLARKFADIAHMHHHALTGLPENVRSIDIERRKRWLRKGLAS